MKVSSVLRAASLFPEVKGKWGFLKGETYWMENRWGTFECADRYSIRQFFPDYEKEVTAVIIAEAENQDGFFIDIGACLGLHSVTAGNLGMKVLALEPNVRTFDILQRNLTRNVVKAEAMNAAAWSSSGVMKFHPANHSDIGTMYETDMEGHYAGTGYDIRTVTLDEVLVGLEPTLIKIDTEKSESEVIKGALATLKEKLPAVVFEALTRERLAEASTLLLPLGYYVAPISKVNYIARRK